MFYLVDFACCKACYSGNKNVLTENNNTFKKHIVSETDEAIYSEKKLLDKNVRKLFVDSIFTKREGVLRNRLDEEILGAIQSKKGSGMSVGDSFEILIRENIEGGGEKHMWILRWL